jgi:hypothetical protein
LCKTIDHMILSRRPLNLVLVHQPSVLEIEDLRIIAAEVKKLAPDIHVSIAEPWMWAGKPCDQQRKRLDPDPFFKPPQRYV